MSQPKCAAAGAWAPRHAGGASRRPIRLQLRFKFSRENALRNGDARRRGVIARGAALEVRGFRGPKGSHRLLNHHRSFCGNLRREIYRKRLEVCIQIVI